MQDFDIANIIDSDEASFSMINRLYAERNKLNKILYQGFPELKEVCRVVMISNQGLILHTNGSKAYHTVKIKQDRIDELLRKHADFKDLKVKNVGW